MERQVIAARPTVYKGIKMRSRLEADYAAYLDRTGAAWGIEWRYEPVCFGSESDQWLPDFSEGEHPWHTYIEVKPLGWFSELVESGRTNEIDALLKRMTVAWASEPDAGLRLVFWEYQAKTEPLSIYTFHQSLPWMVDERGSRWPHGYLWPGMGQSDVIAGAGSAAS